MTDEQTDDKTTDKVEQEIQTNTEVQVSIFHLKSVKN